MYSLKDFFPRANIEKVEIRSYCLKVYLKITLDRDITEVMYREAQRAGAYGVMQKSDRIFNLPADTTKDYCYLQSEIDNQLERDNLKIRKGVVDKEYELPHDLYEYILS